MSGSHENGVVNLASPHSVDETTQRLVDTLEHAGMSIFARIDQQAAAQAAGVTMQAMTLVVFGNARVGTPLMQAYPSLAVDLPLKAVVWEDAAGTVTGLMNTFGNLGGSLSPLVVGYAVQWWSSWSIPLLVAAGVAFSGGIITLFIDTRTSLMEGQ